jgi:hypothetical protein
LSQSMSLPLGPDWSKQKRENEIASMLRYLACMPHRVSILPISGDGTLINQGVCVLQLIRARLYGYTPARGHASADPGTDFRAGEARATLVAGRGTETGTPNGLASAGLPTLRQSTQNNRRSRV